jgi:hypothetical protein
MTTEITIYPLPESNPSPYQQRMLKTPDIVNNDFFGKGGFSFKSLVDIFNPLQQLPVISTAYRELTGATISSRAHLIGGALFGGGIGFAVAIANEIISDATGKDIGGNLFAAVSNQYKKTTSLA